MPTTEAQVAYLLAFPNRTILSPSPPERPQRLKDAPYFEVVDIDIRTIARETVDVDGVRVLIRQQVYDGLIQSAECTFALADALSSAALQTKSRIQATLRARLTQGLTEATGMIEEYSVLLLQRISDTPDQYIEQNAAALARFMRSHREIFDRTEIDEILSSRVRYSERDLTLIDWEGAIVIAPEGDFQSDVELMKIGNYQLLRYRLLDETIERSLRTVSQHLQEGSRPSLLPSRSKGVLRQAIEQRLSLLLDFEKIDQSLLLIGDWYTAKLYHIITDEFYLDEWKNTIKGKLESLESITQIVQDNFTFSWTRLLELLQIVGWLVLLLGYFVLFFLDLRAHQ